jgi:hypothetical protein
MRRRGGIAINEYTFTEADGWVSFNDALQVIIARPASTYGSALAKPSGLLVYTMLPADFHRMFMLWPVDLDPKTECSSVQERRAWEIHTGSLFAASDHFACGILISALIFGDFHGLACSGCKLR